MGVKLNTEFNYRYLVMGETIWEKIKHLRSFLEGRVRAAVLEEVSALKYQAKLAELDALEKNRAQLHLILNAKAEILEAESFFPSQQEAFELNRSEIKILERLLQEAYILAEPSRLQHDDGTIYTDEEMFEANAANEFTVTVLKDAQSEILSIGAITPATIRKAMSNPHTWREIQNSGLMQLPDKASIINPPLLDREMKMITDGTKKEGTNIIPGGGVGNNWR